MIAGPQRYWEYCSVCGMRKGPSSLGSLGSWLDDHEEIACPKGTVLFCFREGNPAETFWEYLRWVTGGLSAPSSTSSAVEHQRAPEWIRQCALEDMDRERNSRIRERYETIASFCRRRADELAQEFAGGDLVAVTYADGGWRSFGRLLWSPGPARPRRAGGSRRSGRRTRDAARFVRAMETLYDVIARQDDLLAEVAGTPCACFAADDTSPEGERECAGTCLPARARQLLAARERPASPVAGEGRP
jgi:hypothetical protein